MTLVRLFSPALVLACLASQGLHAQEQQPSSDAQPPAAKSDNQGSDPKNANPKTPDSQPPESSPTPDQPRSDQPPNLPSAETSPSPDTASPDVPSDKQTRPEPMPEASDDANRTPRLPRDERRSPDDQTPDQGRQSRSPGVTTAEREGRVIVATIEPRLAKLGLRRDDVIVEVDGQPVTRSADFNRRLIAIRPGARVPIIILRGGVRQTIWWTPVVAYQPAEVESEVPDGYVDYEDENAPTSNAYLGVSFNPRYPNAAVILAVNPGSPAEQAGLQPGDVIVRLDGQRVRNARSLTSMVARHPVGAELDLQVSRLQTTQVRLGERPSATQVEASRVPYEEANPPARDGRLFDGDGRILDRRAPNR